MNLYWKKESIKKKVNLEKSTTSQFWIFIKMIGVRQFVRMLENHLNKKFPELKASLYVSKRKKHIHMGLDIALFSLTRHDQVIEKIKKLQNVCFWYWKTFQVCISTSHWLYKLEVWLHDNETSCSVIDFFFV